MNTNKRFIHISTRQIFFQFGTTGLARNKNEVPIPLWLVKDSNDWFEIGDDVPEEINDELMETLIKLELVRRDNRTLLIERGWGDLTDDEFSFYFKYLKEKDYFKRYGVKQIKEAYAEFKKNQET